MNEPIMRSIQLQNMIKGLKTIKLYVIWDGNPLTEMLLGSNTSINPTN